MGIVDGVGYHHDLLEELNHSGIKTWSARRYADAAIIQAILGRYDLSMLILPQLLGKKEKKEQKEKQAEKPVDIRVNVSLVSVGDDAGGKPDIDTASLKFDIAVPRTVGLIYLDTAIEGYFLSFIELTLQ
jgi:hypothetical protein